MTEAEKEFADALLVVRDAYLGPDATPRECIAFAVFALAREARRVEAAVIELERVASTVH